MEFASYEQLILRGWPQALKEPLWILLLDPWACNNILFYRNYLLINYDFKGKVLEIGCGLGWLSLMLKSYVDCFVITTDIGSSKVRKAKDIAVLLNSRSDDYVVCDAAHLPFRDKTFSRVCGNAVLHHVLPSIELVTKEIYRVLDNSGTALFTGEIVASRFLGWLWRKISLQKRPGEGITTLASWQNSFLKAGFTQVKILKENRSGYTKGIFRNIYYRIIQRIPSKFVTKYLVTSVTIVALKT